MSHRQYEAFNVTAPYQGSSGLVALASVAISQTAQAINLSDYFGNLGNGHFITVFADLPGGGTAYINIAPHSRQTPADLTPGRGPEQLFPVPAGQMLPFVFQGGKTVGTSYATNINYASGAILWAKIGSFIPTGGAATGFLRIWRNSASPNQSVEQFPPPGFPNPLPGS